MRDSETTFGFGLLVAQRGKKSDTYDLTFIYLFYRLK